MPRGRSRAGPTSRQDACLSVERLGQAATHGGQAEAAFVVLDPLDDPLDEEPEELEEPDELDDEDEVELSEDEPEDDESDEDSPLPFTVLLVEVLRESVR